MKRELIGLILLILLLGITFSQNANDSNYSYGNDGLCSTEYSPVCGSVQVQCIRAPCEAIEETFANLCELQKKGAKFLYKGICGYPDQNCTPEGNSYPVVPGYKCCDGLDSIQPSGGFDSSTGECLSMVGASICSDCGNGTCEAWEDECNCKEDCDINATITCAKEGENFSRVYKTEYPSSCCEGLTEWESGMDTRKVENGKCVNTNLLAGNPVGTCINCGNGVCEAIENVCNCEKDCLKEPIIPENCVSWFDGCNTCGVENGKITGCTKKYCVRNEEAKCLLYEEENNCICTMQYDPVCAEVENCGDQDFCKENNIPCGVCFTEQKTFGNECLANCENAKIIRKGACNLDCPIYSPPYCPNGKINGETDERGCQRPICEPISSGEFYQYMTWTCNDGSSFKEGSETSCKPYAYWKELARQKCESIIQPCQTIYSNKIENTNSNIVSVDSNILDCKRKINYVNYFDVSAPCDNNCKSYTDESGCKVIACENEKAKKYCGTVCIDYDYETIKNTKENCYGKGGQIIVQMDDAGCTTYVCQEKGTTTCNTLLEEIPKEKYLICEENGGQIVSKTDNNGCVIHFECIGIEKDKNAKIDKEIIKDQTKLLELVLKLETLKIELNKTIDKITALANYYYSKDDEISAEKFTNAVELLNKGITKIEEAKELIKTNSNNFSEENAKTVRELIWIVKEEILNEVLMVLLK